MRSSNRSRSYRITAGIIGLMMLVVVLFSAFFIAAEADHDCCGEDCPICTCIRQCENTLHSAFDGSAAQLSFLIPVLFILPGIGLFAAAVSQETPVSRKVRLND